MKGSKPVRLADVARRANVSPGLVSRIVNGDGTVRVRDDVRNTVLAAVKELGYVPNSSARALRKSQAGAIGLVLNDVNSPIYSEVVRGAQSAASQKNFAILLGDADGGDSASSGLRSALSAGRMDGVLLQGGYGVTDGVLEHISCISPTMIVNAPRRRGRSGSQAGR